MTPLLRRAQPWLGTLVETGIVALSAGANPHRACEAAFDAIARVHRLMSPQEPTSDIARFNEASPGSPVDCDDWTLAVLHAARELAEHSDGLFDITLGSGGLTAWSLDRTRLHKHQAGVRLDLGGIAKGEAVDRACAALREQGVTAGWVNAGGDLRSFGDCTVPVYRRSPHASDRFHALGGLRDGAIATSDFDRVRYPSARYAQVSIAAADCRWADALTKLVALAPEATQSLLPRYHARAWTTAW